MQAVDFLRLPHHMGMDWIERRRKWKFEKNKKTCADKTTFILLYKAMVRPHLEYANAVWCPYKKGDIELIEKFQKELQS